MSLARLLTCKSKKKYAKSREGMNVLQTAFFEVAALLNDINHLELNQTLPLSMIRVPVCASLTSYQEYLGEMFLLGFGWSQKLNLFFYSFNLSPIISGEYGKMKKGNKLVK